MENKNRITILLLFVFTLFAQACQAPSKREKSDDEKSTSRAVAKSNLISFGVQNKQGGTIGAIFERPTEEGWNIKRGEGKVQMKKQGQSSDEDDIIEGYLLRLKKPFSSTDHFVSTIKQNVKKVYGKHERYKLIKYDTVPYQKEHNCVKTNISLIDTKPQRTVKHNHQKHNNQYILSCNLTNRKNIGVEIRYFHRFYKPNEDKLFATKAENLFKSVVLVDR